MACSSRFCFVTSLITSAETLRSGMRWRYFLVIRWTDLGKEMAGTHHFEISKFLCSFECTEIFG